MADKPDDFVFETEHWEVYLNPDQYYLGRSVVAAKREVPTMSDLTNEEWLDFADLVKKLESAFKKTFGAIMFNWSCLMNGAYQNDPPNPHVHWHFRPRYKNPVEFAGQKFEDKEFGRHYAESTESYVTEIIFSEIINTLRGKLM